MTSCNNEDILSECSVFTYAGGNVCKIVSQRSMENPCTYVHREDVLNCKCGLFIYAEMCICNYSGGVGELFSGIVFDTFLICKVWCLDFFSTRQAVEAYVFDELEI